MPSAPLHVYVHIPFCVRTCPYCHFYNIGHDDAREAVYLDGVEREIDRLRGSGALARGHLATLYWGGGTPSILSIPGTRRLAALCRSLAPFAADAEWTLEANPIDVDRERVALWRGLGVDRLSLGAQSFDAARLAFLGRDHDGGTAERAVATAVDAGIANVSIDLMFNLAVPGRRTAWARDLAVAFSLPVAHVSLYGLTIEPGTAFAARARGGARLTVDDRAYAAEYRAAGRVARRAGFEHYEVSSFARPGRRARHNAAYWTGAPYLGIGPAAHGFDGERRWANLASLTGWAEALATGGDPRAFVERPGSGGRALETLYLGLRTAEGAPADHPLLGSIAARPVVDRLLDEGLAVRRDERLALTEAGFLVLDAILDRLAATSPDPPTRLATKAEIELVPSGG